MLRDAGGGYVDSTPLVLERLYRFLLRGFWGNPHGIRVLEDFGEIWRIDLQCPPSSPYAECIGITKGHNMKNKFKGECHTCKTFVAAGAGEYEGGYTTCSQQIFKDDAPEAMNNLFNAWGFSCLNELNRKAGTSFANRFEVRDARNAEQQATAPTAEQIAANKAASELANKQARAARRAELQAMKDSDTCPRCHGKGGSDAWHHTGWNCNRCFGSGKYFN